MQRMIYTVIFLGFILAMSHRASTILVGPGGDIQSAIDQSVWGDTVLLEKDFRIVPSLRLKDGVILRGIRKDSCILNFGGDDYFISVENTSRNVIENLTIISIGVLPKSMVYTDQCRYLSLKNVEFQGGNLSVFARGSYLYIDNVLFSNRQTNLELELSGGIIRNSRFMSDNSGLIIKGNVRDSLIVENNRFETGKSIVYCENAGNGLRFLHNEFSAPSANMMINAIGSSLELAFNRILLQTNATGIALSGSSMAYFHHNVFLSEQSGSAIAAVNCEAVLCHNNTFLNFSNVLAGYESYLSFVNNICANTSLIGDTAIQLVSSKKNVVRYNDFWGFEADVSGTLDTALSEHNIFADPYFISQDFSDTLNFLCLDCQSPCIDSGDPAFDAGKEPDNSIIDMGFTGNTVRGCGYKAVSVDEDSRQPEEDFKLAVYPLPVDDHITIRWGVDEFAREVSIYNLIGERVACFPVSPGSVNFSFNCSRFPAGCYLIRVLSGGKALYARFMICR